MPGTGRHDPPFIKRSRAMQGLVRRALTAATARHRVLLIGESGTGKDAMARWLHERSARAGSRLHWFDCARSSTAQSSDWTALRWSTHPIFREGGTLVLDGIERMPLPVQETLPILSLQTRLTGPEIQVIAMSRWSRRRLSAEGDPLERLLQVLGGPDLSIPPLRERRPDLPQLVREILRRICREQEVPRQHPDADALDLLCGYHWPGNVTELEEVLDRAALAAEGRAVIEVDDLPRGIRGAGHRDDNDGDDGEVEPLADVEQRHILAALQVHRGNRQATADALGIGVNTLWRRLKEYGVARIREPRVSETEPET